MTTQSTRHFIILVSFFWPNSFLNMNFNFSEMVKKKKQGKLVEVINWSPSKGSSYGWLVLVTRGSSNH